jgi:hypothetical protein
MLYESIAAEKKEFYIGGTGPGTRKQILDEERENDPLWRPSSSKASTQMIGS